MTVKSASYRQCQGCPPVEVEGNLAACRGLGGRWKGFPSWPCVSRGSGALLKQFFEWTKTPHLWTCDGWTEANSWDAYLFLLSQKQSTRFLFDDPCFFSAGSYYSPGHNFAWTSFLGKLYVFLSFYSLLYAHNYHCTLGCYTIQQ